MEQQDAGEGDRHADEPRLSPPHPLSDRVEAALRAGATSRSSTIVDTRALIAALVQRCPSRGRRLEPDAVVA
jgi:hypothetical protein